MNDDLMTLNVACDDAYRDACHRLAELHACGCRLLAGAALNCDLMRAAEQLVRQHEKLESLESECDRLSRTNQNGGPVDVT